MQIPSANSINSSFVRTSVICNFLLGTAAKLSKIKNRAFIFCSDGRERV